MNEIKQEGAREGSKVCSNDEKKEGTEVKLAEPIENTGSLKVVEEQLFDDELLEEAATPVDDRIDTPLPRDVDEAKQE